MRPIQLFVFAACAVLSTACDEKPSGSSRSPNTPEGIATDVDRGLRFDWVGDAEVRPPMSLTASDGTGLQLVSLGARSVVDGPLAFTELHLVFDNPENRQREGRFEITLPPSAAVSRFAMRIDDHWQEAEVVERQQARAAYEDFLHRKQDPALLEKKAGNQFRARVFPIGAGAQKEIILSYSEQLSGNAPYRLALAGLPSVERLSVEVRVPGESSEMRSATASALKRTDLKDLVLHVETDPSEQGLRFETLAMGRIRVNLKIPQSALKDLTIAFDTSGSRALGYAGQVGRLSALIATLRKKRGEFALRVIAFDQDVAEIYAGPASGFSDIQAQQLHQRLALGASNLSRLFDWLAANGNGHNKASDRRVILYGDGIVTAGERDPAELRKLAAELSKRGYTRLDAVVDGGIRDEAALRLMVNAGLASTGVLVDASASDIAERLLSQTRSGVKITVPGAKWSWPTRADGLQDGDELFVFAHLPIGTDMRVVLSGIDDAPKALSLRQTQRPLLERAWIGSDIARLTEKLAQPGADEPQKNKLKARILKLSVQHRVLSDLTALLVLETETDYARFSIDRTALTDILTVGQTGVQLQNRSALAKGNPSRGFVRKAPTVTPRGQVTWNEESSPAEPPAQQPVLEVMEDSEGSSRGRRDQPPIREESRRVAAQIVPRIAPEQKAARRLAPGAAATVSTFGAGTPVPPADGAPDTVDPMSALGALMGDSIGSQVGSAQVAPFAAGHALGSGQGTSRARRTRTAQVRTGNVVVRGSLEKSVVRRIVERHIDEVRFCYERGLSRRAGLKGEVKIKFLIAPNGQVQTSVVSRSTLANPAVEQCIARSVRRWTFRAPDGGGIVVVTYPFHLKRVRQRRPTRNPRARSSVRPSAAAAIDVVPPGPVPRYEEPPSHNAHSGTFSQVMDLLANDELEAASQLALAWHRESPGDVLALIALGESYEASQEFTRAARVYGTLIDLFPSRADLRRMAGERLERLGETGQALALDSYRVAVEQRPDHPSSHRLYGYALLQDGRFADAFSALQVGFLRKYPSGRFSAVLRILGEDLGLVAAAWVASDSNQKSTVTEKLAKLSLTLPTEPSTRFVLHWETDANDVDLHIYDKRNDHVFYKHRQMSSGGELYADVTTGYGPECFTIPGRPAAYPYTLQAHYYSRGPMGYGMGKLQIVQHDGQGHLFMQHRPFVVMNDKAYVDLGTLDGPLPGQLPATPKHRPIKPVTKGYVPPAPEL